MNLEQIITFLIKNAPQIIISVGLCYGIAQARRVTNDVVNNVHKIGENSNERAKAAHKALFNFYMILALLFMVGIRFLNLIQNDLFIGVLIAILTALGIKLTLDIKG